MDHGLTVEFLGNEPAEPSPDHGVRPPSAWTRPRRIAAVAAAAALLVAAGVVATRLMPAPSMPTVLITVPPDDGSFLLGDDIWRSGADGRPSSAVRVSATPRVERTVPPEAHPYADAQLQVLGLAGPGVTRNESPPTAVPADDRTVTVPVHAQIDCTRVPETVPDDAYGLRVRATYAGRKRSQVVTDPAAGPVWARQIRSACSAWTARRALTITRLTTRLHPDRTTLDVSFTVVNSGDRRASLDRVEAHGTLDGGGFPFPLVTGPLPVDVPPHGSATAALTLRPSRCDVADPGKPGAPVLSSRVGLLASAGQGPGNAAQDALISVSPRTGVVLDGDAAAALNRGLIAVCGGMAPPVLTVPVGGVRRAASENSGELLLDVDIALAPGRARSLVVDPEPTAFTILTDAGRQQLPTAPDFINLTPVSTAQTVVPDASGHARVTIHVTAPEPRGACSDTTIGVPLLRLTVPVREAGGERVLQYLPEIDARKDVFAPLVCRAG